MHDQAPSLIEERSRKIQEKLLGSEEFKAGSLIMTYVSLPAEVDTHYLNKTALEEGKRVAVPYLDPGDRSMTVVEITSMDRLEKGPFGIYQPKEGLFKKISLKEIDLIVVPAIAYDRKNIRLGRGKGYYDRFLSSPELSSSKTIGLAFQFQVLDSLPSDLHDKPVLRVITD